MEKDAGGTLGRSASHFQDPIADDDGTLTARSPAAARNGHRSPVRMRIKERGSARAALRASKSNSMNDLSDIGRPSDYLLQKLAFNFQLL